MSENHPSPNVETEIKLRLSDRASFAARLSSAAFRLRTPETLERNVLYDTTDGELRKHGQLLRIRQYGSRWTLTHKAPTPSAASGRHKQRIETETNVEDGGALDTILRALGYRPIFAYEKRRTEWSDGQGHAVIDVTPIGDFAELEGRAEWIDQVAALLGFSPEAYITASYGQLFAEWRSATGSRAENMTFGEVGER